MLPSVSPKNKWPTAVLAKYSTISIYTMTLSMKFTKVSSQSHDWDQQVQGKDKILLSGHLLKELQLLEFKKKKKVKREANEPAQSSTWAQTQDLSLILGSHRVTEKNGLQRAVLTLKAPWHGWGGLDLWTRVCMCNIQTQAYIYTHKNKFCKLEKKL